jgi:hypothetical protein
LSKDRIHKVEDAPGVYKVRGEVKPGVTAVNQTGTRADCFKIKGGLAESMRCGQVEATAGEVIKYSRFFPWGPKCSYVPTGQLRSLTCMKIGT